MAAASIAGQFVRGEAGERTDVPSPMSVSRSGPPPSARPARRPAAPACPRRRPARCDGARSWRFLRSSAAGRTAPAAPPGDGKAPGDPSRQHPRHSGGEERAVWHVTPRRPLDDPDALLTPVPGSGAGRIRAAVAQDGRRRRRNRMHTESAAPTATAPATIRPGDAARGRRGRRARRRLRRHRHQPDLHDPDGLQPRRPAPGAVSDRQRLRHRLADLLVGDDHRHASSTSCWCCAPTTTARAGSCR